MDPLLIFNRELSPTLKTGNTHQTPPFGGLKYTAGDCNKNTFFKSIMYNYLKKPIVMRNFSFLIGFMLMSATTSFGQFFSIDPEFPDVELQCGDNVTLTVKTVSGYGPFITGGDYIRELDFGVLWDPAQFEYVSHDVVVDVSGAGVSVDIYLATDDGELAFSFRDDPPTETSFDPEDVFITIEYTVIDAHATDAEIGIGNTTETTPTVTVRAEDAGGNNPTMSANSDQADLVTDYVLDPVANVLNCVDEGAATLVYSLSEGTGETNYDLIFDGAAQMAGFGNVEDGSIATAGEIEVALPAGETGLFNATLYVGEAEACKSTGQAVVFDISDCSVTNVTQMINYQTIQEAIDDAMAGDVIEVSAGTYQGALEILTDNLTLKSLDGAASTIIDADGAVNGIEIGEYNHPGIHPTGVIIEGFTVDNWTERGIGQRNGNGTIQIIDNTVVGPSSGSIVRGGIILSGGVGSLVKGNTVTVPEFGSVSWSSAGIMLLGTVNAIVEDNIVIGFPAESDIGIGLFGYPDWSGIDPNWVSASGNLIRNNTVEDAGYGIGVVGNCDNTTITENHLSDNDQSVRIYEQLGGTPSGFTNIEKNLLNNLINNVAGYSVDANCNYWGSDVYSEVEDAISGDVIFVPFLEENPDGNTFSWSGTETYSCTGETPIVYEDSDGNTFYYTDLQEALDDLPASDGTPGSGGLLKVSDEGTGEVSYFIKDETDTLFQLTPTKDAMGNPGSSGLWIPTIYGPTPQ